MGERRYAPAVIVRNLDEARQLGEIIASNDPPVRQKFYDIFADRRPDLYANGRQQSNSKETVS